MAHISLTPSSRESSSSRGGGGGGGSTSESGGSNNANMYRVGDYVYFENASASSYAIRRIDELNKTANGNVEARVLCLFRRAELSPSLLAFADRHHWGDSVSREEKDKDSADDSDEEPETEESKAKAAERVAFKLREVFLSRQVETLPATLIRGKCSVTLLSEVETIQSYTEREDAFFYALVYDPHQKTLVADRGEIRIGSSYQATVPAVFKNPAEEDQRKSEDLEEMLWDPNSDLSQSDIEKYLIVARSVGTFARALDCSSSVKQPSLHMSAAAASRDVTLFHAYNLLHKHKYNLAEAIKSLVPNSGPMLCRDEMEDWSAAEANLFEEAMEKYGKDFNAIRKDFLPWKTAKNIIEYFFMWKTTDRYVQQKRMKAIESESKLKQVYVPAYTNKSTRLTGPNGEIIVRGKDCDAYPTMPKYSWMQYKKYGKFVNASHIEDSFILDKSSFSNMTAARLAQLRPGLIIEPGSPAVGGPGGLGPVGPNGKTASGKTRAAFYLRTTPVTRSARILCHHLVRLRHAARKPGKPIDMKAIKAETLAKINGMAAKKIRGMNTFSTPKRGDMAAVVKKLGQTNDAVQEWLVLTPKDKLPKPAQLAYPRPSKRPDGSYIYERIPNAHERAMSMSAGGHGHHHQGGQHQQLLYKKRTYDGGPGQATTGPGSGGNNTSGGSQGGQSGGQRDSGGDLHHQMPKIQRTAPANPQIASVAGKSRVATLTRMQGGTKQIISWMDAPDDVFYKATAASKKIRKRFPVILLRRAARKPFKKVLTLP